jgi:hypothetical protein
MFCLRDHKFPSQNAAGSASESYNNSNIHEQAVGSLADYKKKQSKQLIHDLALKLICYTAILRKSAPKGYVGNHTGSADEQVISPENNGIGNPFL